MACPVHSRQPGTEEVPGDVLGAGGGRDSQGIRVERAEVDRGCVGPQGIEEPPNDLGKSEQRVTVLGDQGLVHGEVGQVLLLPAVLDVDVHDLFLGDRAPDFRIWPPSQNRCFQFVSAEPPTAVLPGVWGHVVIAAHRLRFLRIRARLGFGQACSPLVSVLRNMPQP